MNFNEKSVLITGGTSGLGEACAHEFSKCGARVTVIGRDLRKAEAAVAEIARRGGTAFSVIGDVSDAEFCEFAVQRALEKFGPLHVLINSAGVNVRGSALDLTDSQWIQVQAINVNGTYWMCRAAIRAMRETGGGSIVNVSSDWGVKAGANHVAYCASKGAVVNMTRALALDHIRDGIRINVICPGEIRTPMLQGGLVHRGFDSAKGMEELGATIPIGRVSEPEEQARCIRFLASEDASFVVGAVLSVDGGSTAH